MTTYYVLDADQPANIQAHLTLAEIESAYRARQQIDETAKLEWVEAHYDFDTRPFFLLCVRIIGPKKTGLKVVGAKIDAGSEAEALAILDRWEL